MTLCFWSCRLSAVSCRHDNVGYLEKLKGLVLRLERTLEDKVSGSPRWVCPTGPIAASVALRAFDANV